MEHFVFVLVYKTNLISTIVDAKKMGLDTRESIRLI